MKDIYRTFLSMLCASSVFLYLSGEGPMFMGMGIFIFLILLTSLLGGTSSTNN